MDIWKRIYFDGFKRGMDFVIFFEENPIFNIGSFARSALISREFVFLTDYLDLTVKTPNDLGFENDASYKDICKRAVSLGLGLCPLYVGPVLRAAYEDQPYNDVLNIAMPPICVYGFGPSIFNLWRMMGTMSINCTSGVPSYAWKRHHKFVFTVPRR
jgi:hypothetical protein